MNNARRGAKRVGFIRDLPRARGLFTGQSGFEPLQSGEILISAALVLGNSRETREELHHERGLVLAQFRFSDH